MRYRDLFENANDIVYTIDLDGLITSMNLSGLRTTGYSLDEVLSMNIEQMISPDDIERANANFRKKMEDGSKSTSYEIDIVAKDGRRIPVEVNTRLVFRDGKPLGVQGIARDVTERKSNEARFRLLFERNLAGVFRSTVGGKILECNDAMARIFGYERREEMIDVPAGDLYIDPEDRQRFLTMITEQKSLTNLELRMKRRDGSPVWVLENVALLEGGGRGESEIIEGTIIDVTDRKTAHEQIEWQAYHDALTGLPNRLLFRDRITIALARARRSARSSAVMFLDLDQFKLVNDTLGHTAGDRLLQAVADRLVNCVRAEDTVARMGGDEFTILLSDIGDRRAAAVVAQKVLDSIGQPIDVDRHELFVTTSVGISIYPDDGSDAESLLKNADRAMYRAKEAGRNNYQFVTAAAIEGAAERLSLENSLHHAFERQEFVVHYQPMIELATGRVVGAEALIRWNHPDFGIMPPDEFIPIAEETRLIIPMGEWVLRTACKQMKAWHDSGHPGLRIAVNLSPRQFQQRDLTTMIERVIAETAFPPHCLDLEITESTAMQNAELSLSIMKRLKEMGIRISIDDFGTGYSSLNYLKRFPIDTVKIDQDFVRDLSAESSDGAIISAVISMARALRLRVVAEGVETEEQLAFLQREQCAEIQGFLYSQPLPAAEFERTLKLPARATTERVIRP
jgi:diguanylate cyclase (GGDEF)-like protein/PAS domain S-box-containing protein